MRFGVDRRVLWIAAALVLVVCTSEFGVSSARAEGTCANEQLRAEQPYALELPDCRAYEQVSPAAKDDNNAYENEGARAAVSGEAITYSSFGSFAEPKGTQYQSWYVSRRGADGWSTQNITTPYSGFLTTLYSPFESLLFTPELSEGLAETDAPLSSEALPGFENIYVAGVANDSYQLVTSGEKDEEPYKLRNPPRVVGASTNLSHVVFSNESIELYDWVGGQLSLVSTANSGESLGEVAAGGGDEYGTFGQDTWRAVSVDGSRIFMTTGNFFQPNRQLYVRENAEQPQSPVGPQGECTVSSDACTVEVSASQRTDCADHDPCSGTPEPDPAGPRSARYWGASVDGSRVFFTSCAKLTNDSKAVAPSEPTEDPCSPGQAGTGNDLYEYDLESKQLTDLTVDDHAGDVDGAAVLGVVDISEEGSYVYFVAEGELAAGAVPGQPNLYVYHGGTTAFIATLAPRGNGEENPGDSRDWSGGPGLETVRETPDGAHLAFLSTSSLTGYDNADANTGEPDTEVFSYDATSGVLVCASCNPSGARPIGSSSFGEVGSSATSNDYTPRNFSEDGIRLFFQTDDALVTHDSNGLRDVYEYEDGHVYPISDVAGGYDSSFIDTSPSGDDVFIATANRLLPQDEDSRVDIYDVRVGGGFPVSVSPPVCDNGDSCKPPVTPQPPIFGAPASATFVGAGNPVPVVSRPVVKTKRKTKPKKKKKKIRDEKKKNRHKGKARGKKAGETARVSVGRSRRGAGR